MSQKSDRHWYPRYPGDYARKTAHLSLVEHGAYALLMDWYYSNGKPLPNDWVQMHRICKAIAPDEQTAVQTIVQQFFTLSDAGWSNSRADEEIQRKAEISDKRRDAQRQREQNRSKTVSKAGANGGANAPSNAHTTTSTSTLDNSNELSPPTPKERSADLQDQFAEFYSAYPHKVGRDAAQKAYQRTLKGKGVTHANLIDGARRFAAAHASAGTEKRFVPHPATWLNAGRWQDDLSGITARGNGPQPAANARGSQFGAVKSALSELLEETAGHMADGPAGLSEWGVGTPLDVHPAERDAPLSIPDAAGRGYTAGGQTIDHDPAFPADG